jgi:hypothetical protein
MGIGFKKNVIFLAQTSKKPAKPLLVGGLQPLVEVND